MTLGTPVAADVPALFDVVINGHGHVFDRAQDPRSISYIPRAMYTYGATFVERQNTSGGQPDQAQDFWFTFSQNDWSLGEQQRYFRAGDGDKARRYWAGADVDVGSTAGQVSIARTPVSQNVGTSTSTTCVTACPGYQGNGIVYVGSDGHVYAGSSSTDLGFFPSSGTASCVTVDSTAPGDTNSQIYVSNGSKVDRYDGSWHTAWSASGAQRLCFLNNTLYGLGSSASVTDLFRFDTSGVKTTIFQWKGATGTSPTGLIASITNRLLYPYGGKLLILVPNSGFGPSLWIYDGTAPAKVADFPIGFTATDLCVVNGVVYVSGRKGTGTFPLRDQAVVYYYANGSIGILWSGNDTTSTSGCYVAPYNGNLAISPPGSGGVLVYNSATGGVSSIASSVGGRLEQGLQVITGTNYSVLYGWATSATTIKLIYGFSTPNATGSISHSLFDADSSLTKYFKGVKVDWDAATDGNGGSVDISYQLNSVDGSYTSVQTGAVAGTEYAIGQNGRSISIKVTLNKGTSTNGPILKRVSVRGAPMKSTAPRLRKYVLDLSGVNGTGNPQLNNGQQHPIDGLAQAQQLVTAITSTSPVQITDRFGTFTGILEPDGCEIREAATEEYLAVITVRET